jgi:Fur family ferric uptake transcriptional regulator/Fur family peroxide stress response transcriptional regulator
MRITRQRAAVLAALRAHCDHPTAEQIHDEVRRDLPRISLGTVYRLLGALAAAGEARVLVREDGPNRYDSAHDAHHHVFCTACGRIADVPDLVPPDMRAEIERWTGYSLAGFRLDWHGVCPDCRSSTSDGT